MIKGSFPLELKRTKPYGYLLFTLDAIATIYQVLSNPNDNLFTYTTKISNKKKINVNRGGVGEEVFPRAW